MTSSSVAYFLFLAVVLVACRLAGERHRWLVLLGASYAFYASLGSPLLVVALLAVTFIAHSGGALVAASADRRRTRLLAGAVAACLAVLVLLRWLPGFAAVGVSYFVFQGISYLVDVYLERQPPEPARGRFALYMAFFPKLLQGPIERAGSLLPQLRSPGLASPEQIEAGVKLIILGLFKKMVIADRVAPYVDAVYASPTGHQGWPLLLATYCFAVQIYCDFSGYTDIALGAARLLGVRLTDNFRSPYLAVSLADFWRRWHISLSSWLADYLFRPLQVTFRGAGTAGVAAALVVTFTLCGAWHGFTWTFLAWGALHGVMLAFGFLWRSWWPRCCRWMGVAPWAPPPWLRMAWTFHLVWVSWIVFRAGSLAEAAHVLTHLHTGLTVANLRMAVVLGSDTTAVGRWVVTLFMLALLIAHELGQLHPGWLGWLRRRHAARMGFWVALCCFILLLGVRGGRFVYQQF